MRYILYFSILISLLLIGCGSESTEKQSESSFISAKEVLVFDNEDNLSEDLPLLSAVSTATTDINGNIYLVDPRTLHIHSYDSSGSHLWSTGGKGTGPDRFQRISALSVIDETLYVYEYPRSKISTYSQGGEKLNEWQLGEAGPAVREMRYSDNHGFIATGWSAEDATLVNVFTSDFEKSASFISRKEFFQTEDTDLEKQVFNSHPGSALPLDDGLVVYTPHIYDGTMYIYEENSAGEWGRWGAIEGYTEINEPVIIHKTSQGEHERSHLSGFDPSGGYFHTEYISRSHGLYKLGNGLIAHVSSKLKENDKWDLIVEYFDPGELELQDVDRIKNFIPSQQPEIIPIWLDKQGQLYVTERSDTPFKVYQLSDS